MHSKVLQWLRVGVALSTVSLLSPTALFAATADDNFDVTATIIASCTITAGDLAFGNYDPLAVANNDNTSTISVTCTNGAAYNILLDGGTVAGDVANRSMDDDATGTQNLNYALFRDAGRTNNWGETIGTDTLTGTGIGVNQNITVYGRITAGQTAPTVGAYTDTVTATIDF